MWCIFQYCAIALLQADSEGDRRLIQYVSSCSTWFSVKAFIPAELHYKVYLQVSGSVFLKVLFSTFWYFPILKIEENVSSHHNQAPVILYFVPVVTCKRQPMRSSFY